MFDHVGVHVGRRRDQDRVDILGVHDRVDAADLSRIALGDRLGSLGNRVSHGHQFGAGCRGDGPRMHRADAPGAQQPEISVPSLQSPPLVRRARPVDGVTSLRPNDALDQLLAAPIVFSDRKRRSCSRNIA